MSTPDADTSQHPRYGTPEFERRYERYEQGKILGYLLMGVAMVGWVVGLLSDANADRHSPGVVMGVATGIGLVGVGVLAWASTRRAQLFQRSR